MRKKALWRPMGRIRTKTWMAGTSPAMTQLIEIYKDRHARPRAGHPREAAGTAVITEFGVFPHPADTIASLDYRVGSANRLLVTRQQIKQFCEKPSGSFAVERRFNANSAVSPRPAMSTGWRCRRRRWCRSKSSARWQSDGGNAGRRLWGRCRTGARRQTAGRRRRRRSCCG